MSLILLWDAWNKHNGQPTLFGTPIAAPTASAPGSTPAGLPAPATLPGAVAATPAAPASGAVGVSEKFTVTTDVFKVTLDSRGGEVSRVEMLNYKDQADPTQPVVLLDDSPQRVYLAQSGFIAGGGATLPTHFTTLTAQPGERTLKAGTDELVVRFESPEG
eukprot:gene52833-70631_t